ncbi:MAG TPA: Fur family transcriptional regulator [Syntrophomonadaceae bacterium]|nr:Fur family transcriptional regulator [Syntrophomonadaceae bacterium]
MDIKHIKKKINDSNYKLTPQRSTILEVMINNQDEHLSAEEVFIEAKEAMPNIGIATVYRTLDKLTNLGVLYKTMFESDKYRYELSGADEDHQHHHIICIGCNSIIEIEEDFLHTLEAELEAKGYKIIGHELKFYGYCPKCQ